MPANVDTPRGFQIVGADGNAIKDVCEVADNQTINPGDALIISSGKLAIALSNSGEIHGVAAARIVTTTATALDVIPFYPAVPQNRFRAQCSGTFTQAKVGTEVDIEGTTGIMEVNEDANTEKVFLVQNYTRSLQNSIGANTEVVGIFSKSSYCKQGVAI